MSGYQEQPMSENVQTLNAGRLTGTSRNVKKLNTGIYQIINIINGKRYIGSAKDLYCRKHIHFSLLKNNKHHNINLQRAFFKYGSENFKFEILLYCAVENLIFFEQRAIDSFSFENELYNFNPKAENCLGVKHTLCSRSNMSNAHKGKKLSEEHKRKIKEKSANMTKETREKISKALKGKNSYLFGRNGISHPCAKSIYQIDKNTNEIIKEWETISSACNSLGITSSHISEICNGSKIRKTAGGFKWEFANKQEDL